MSIRTVSLRPVAARGNVREVQ
uniref:Uncharacterized protein n=1 Tax=Anguilla anguilla TaxID=7936 RepID=A0A0E9U4Z5_ANGAN